MEFREYQALVREIPLGKKLPDAIYLHESALEQLPAKLAKHVAQTIIGLALDERDWNIVKFSKNDHKITLLNYPTFFDDAYPALDRSFTINLEKLSVRESDYSQSDNPPILHRKETFLAPNHPSVAKFSKITEEGAKAGLYENTRTIGFRKSWENLISRKGYILDSEGHLQPKRNDTKRHFSLRIDDKVKVERHLTAINRDKLSAPMQLLARHDYLNAKYSVFDYGCGKGDDVRELEAHGLNITAWDPVYRQDGEKIESDIVNLGYVINVIEDRAERDEALKQAYRYSQKILAVSAMIAGEATISKFPPYKDGVITSRNTFQKYYSQSELRSYIETTLSAEPIAVAPGTFFIFKDKNEEQIFLSQRQRIKRNWAQLTQRERLQTAQVSIDEIAHKHKQLFDDFWETCLDLGRIPANSEFEFSDRIRSICGSHNKAFLIASKFDGQKSFQQATQYRQDDLLVYFALGLFSRRKPYSQMPESMKRDLKAFFGNYNQAIEQATILLFSVGNPKTITEACNNAYKQLNCGELIEGHSLCIHRSKLNDLPPTLRIYIGCATQLYGDLTTIDLIKIHMQSGKVSLMKYDNFETKKLPLLQERVKIKLREQDIDFFVYQNGHEPQPLYRKSLYLEKGSQAFKQQSEFETLLSGETGLDFTGFGPSLSELEARLAQNGLSIQSLLQNTSINH